MTDELPADVPPSPHAGIDLWHTLAAMAAVELSDDQIDQLMRYLDLLFAANERMNLTRITDRAAAEVQHVGDALTLLPFLPPGKFTLADVGSGGGVPGIPLAIARPDARVTLIESTKKKALFLEEAVMTLRLKNVRIMPDRAEAFGARGSPGHEKFDIVTVRAVAPMTELATWCLPLLKAHGKLLAAKGPKVADELPTAQNIIARLGGKPASIHTVDSLPEIHNHVIVQIEKRRPKYKL